MHPFRVNGPWLLCGHMQPSPVRLDHVQYNLPEKGAFTAGLLNSVGHTSCISSLPFCSSNVIHHFFCDSPQFLSSLVLTHAYMKVSCPLLLVWISLELCRWSSPPTPTFYSTFSVCIQGRGDAKHSPPVHLTWQPSSCSIPPPSILIWDLLPATVWIRTKWLLYSTQGYPHVKSSDLQPQE